MTPELLSKIREAIFDGKTQEAIKEELGIPRSTWDTWFYENYEGFRLLIEGWRRDYKISLASKNLKEFLTMKTESTKITKDGEPIVDVDPALVRIKADMTKFTLETLDPQHQKKSQVDLTTAGKPLILPAEVIKRYGIDGSSEADSQ